MKNTIYIILGIALGIVLGMISLSLVSPRNFGSILTQNIQFGGATNTTSSVGMIATTTPIVSASIGRNWLYVTYSGNNSVTLYPAGNTTTTNITSLGGGIVLSSTTQRTVDLSNFTGYLMGIADTTSTVIISHN